MSNEGNFETILALSTAHMPSSVPDFGDVRVESHEYGWIVFVSRELGEGANWLHPIIKTALERECTLILFDRDASTFDGLKTYEW